MRFLVSKGDGLLVGFRVVGREPVVSSEGARNFVHVERASPDPSVVPMGKARRAQKVKPSYPGKIAIRHAVEAARSLGIDIGGLEFSPDGIIRLLDRGTLPAQPLDEFAQWEQAGRLA
jgi:hypothetical protein